MMMSLALGSNSQVIGCEDHLWNDLYCVGWGVKLYSIQHSQLVRSFPTLISVKQHYILVNYEKMNKFNKKYLYKRQTVMFNFNISSVFI